MRILWGLAFGLVAVGCALTPDPTNTPPLDTGSNDDATSTPPSKKTTTTPKPASSASPASSSSSSPVTTSSSSSSSSGSSSSSCNLAALKGTWTLDIPMWEGGAENCVQTTGNAPFLPSGNVTIKAVDDGSYLMTASGGVVMPLDVDEGDCMLVATLSSTTAAGDRWNAQIFVTASSGKAEFSDLAQRTAADGTTCEANSDIEGAKQ